MLVFYLRVTEGVKEVLQLFKVVFLKVVSYWPCMYMNEYLDAFEDEGTMENWCKGEEGKAMEYLRDCVQTSIIRDPV